MNIIDEVEKILKSKQEVFTFHNPHDRDVMVTKVKINENRLYVEYVGK